MSERDEYGEFRDEKTPVNIMQELEAMALLYMAQEEEVAKATLELERVTGLRNKTRFEAMPELMKRAGNMVEYKFELPDGRIAVFDRSKDTSGAISKGNREFILKYMRENGYGHLQSNDITLSYTAGQEADIAKAREILDHSELAGKYSVDSGVHSSRYTAWCDRMVESSKITQDQFGLFGIHVVDQVKFKVKDPKPSKKKRA